jgi:hypothetical protein
VMPRYNGTDLSGQPGLRRPDQPGGVQRPASSAAGPVPAGPADSAANWADSRWANHAALVSGPAVYGSPSGGWHRR